MYRWSVTGSLTFLGEADLIVNFAGMDDEADESEKLRQERKKERSRQDALAKEDLTAIVEDLEKSSQSALDLVRLQHSQAADIQAGQYWPRVVRASSENRVPHQMFIAKGLRLARNGVWISSFRTKYSLHLTAIATGRVC